jgi:hypothetical protein
VLRLEAFKEFLANAVWPGFEAFEYAWPDPLERIFPRAPVPCRSWHGAMGCSDFSVLPGRRQALEKGIEISIVTRSKMWSLARCKFSKVMLNGSDLL